MQMLEITFCMYDFWVRVNEGVEYSVSDGVVELGRNVNVKIWHKLRFNDVCMHLNVLN